VARQREVTARMRAETDRRAREAEGREHDLTEFVHLVSHDVTQPLASANFYVQVLRRALDQGDLTAARTHLSGIEVAVDRTDRLIRDLVEAARIEGGQIHPQRQPVDLVALIADLVARLQGSLPVERVRVESAGEVVADVDPLLLERVVTNLIGNALNYSPESTPVLVGIGSGADEALISVADRGIGIGPEELPSLFQRGYRTEAATRTAGGTGLGLYIARLLVEANDGRIWAESRVGEGSTFRVALRKAPMGPRGSPRAHQGGMPRRLRGPARHLGQGQSREDERAAQHQAGTERLVEEDCREDDPQRRDEVLE
jgi:signal transduction histidine kinase